MASRMAWGWLSGASVFLATAAAQAQCTKDMDCKGDRVCEAGQCAAPPALPPAPPAPPGGVGAAAPETAPTSAAPAPTVAPSAVATPPAAPAPAAATQPLDARGKPLTERHNRAMMVGGIIIVSVGPLALLIALLANMDSQGCHYDLDTRALYNTLPASSPQARDRCDAKEREAYAFGIGGALLIGGGIPMIIIGGKKVPVKNQTVRASLAPWATSSAGGLQLRLDL